jgi:hypothetical protein
MSYLVSFILVGLFRRQLLLYFDFIMHWAAF